jgi:hypothetical protein
VTPSSVWYVALRLQPVGRPARLLPHGARAVEHTAPAPAYLSMMATGLRESPGWDDDEVSVYLDALVSG